MFFKKIKKIFLIILFIFLIFLPLWFLIPAKKIISFGYNIDKKILLNKKMNKINILEIKNIILKNEDIKNIRILKTPFGIIFVFSKKREILAYYNDNGILKGIDQNGNIFRTIYTKERLPVLSGNRNRIIEGLYLLRIDKNIDTVFLTEYGPLTDDGFHKILWGYDDYQKKKNLIDKIKKNLSEKGIIDMRFKNNIFFMKEERCLN